MKKIFDQELKEKVVILSFLRDDISDVVAELGVNKASIYRWSREFENSDLLHFFKQSFTDKKDLENQNARIKDFIKDAETERDMLVKSLKMNDDKVS